MSKNLRSFLDSVKDETVFIDEPVSPRFAINAYAEAYERRQMYPLLFFNNVEKKKVVTNVFASTSRMGRALGCREGERVSAKFFKLAAEPIPPVTVTAHPYEVDERDISSLPHIVHNELDGGAFIDSGLTVLKDPESGALNMGIYRQQIYDEKHIGILADPGHDAQLIIEKYSKLKMGVPVTINISLHPAAYFGAVSRPLGIGGEMDAAGGFLQEPLEIAVGEEVNIPYLVQSEAVIEGVIEDPSVVREEGPFGEWPKYYSGKQRVPIITVKRVRMKEDFIYLDIAAAFKDHLNLGVNIPHLASVYNSVKAVSPSVKDVRFGYDFAPLLYIQMEKLNEGDAKRAAMAALATEIAIRMVIVVDEDVDIYSDEAVFWAVTTRVSHASAFTIIEGSLGNFLNPAGYSAGGENRTLDDKVIIDATKPITGFPTVAGAPKDLVASIMRKIETSSKANN